MIGNDIRVIRTGMPVTRSDVAVIRNNLTRNEMAQTDIGAIRNDMERNDTRIIHPVCCHTTLLNRSFDATINIKPII